MPQLSKFFKEQGINRKKVRNVHRQLTYICSQCRKKHGSAIQFYADGGCKSWENGERTNWSSWMSLGSILAPQTGLMVGRKRERSFATKCRARKRRISLSFPLSQWTDTLPAMSIAGRSMAIRSRISLNSMSCGFVHHTRALDRLLSWTMQQFIMYKSHNAI